MLNFAIETAREAGQILLEKFGRKINISKKGDIDLVTEADLASEKLIVEADAIIEVNAQSCACGSRSSAARYARAFGIDTALKRQHKKSKDDS